LTSRSSDRKAVSSASAASSISNRPLDARVVAADHPGGAGQLAELLERPGGDASSALVASSDGRGPTHSSP
jgi:hypothetical protein